MTVSSELAHNWHTANGVATSFAFTWKCYDPSHVVVTRRVAGSGTVQTMTRGAHYTVSLNADQGSNPGGTITAINTWAPAENERITIDRRVPLTQLLDLINGDGFDAEGIERAFDLLAMGLADMRATLDRCLQISTTFEGVSPILPKPEPDTVLSWDEAGTGFSNFTPNISLEIPDGSVTVSKIAPGAVTQSKLADESVTTAKLASNVLDDFLTDLWSAPVNASGQRLENVLLRTSMEDLATPAVAAGAMTINLDQGNIQRVNLSANVTSIAFSNVPAAGRWCGIRLYLKQASSGGYTVTWPSSIKWPDSTAPTLSSAAGLLDVVLLATMDGGTTWEGELVAAGINGLALS